MKKEKHLRQTRMRIAAFILCAVLNIGGLARVATANPTLANEQVSTPDIVRFLEQATFGPYSNYVDFVKAMPGETTNEKLNAFLDWQFSNDPEPYNFPYVAPRTQNRPPGCDNNANCRRAYNLYPLQQHFLFSALHNEEQQLRMRMVFALSQILVVSGAEGDLNRSDRFIHYFRMLYNNAFGNFHKLLYDVTLHPVMGRYLDMRGSYRAAPNENYAREILQLFSIGLDVLDLNLGSPTYGVPILDGEGNRVPTYRQEEITAFARAFTGWNYEAAVPDPEVPGATATNYRDPMRTIANQHDMAEKVLLSDPYGSGEPTVLPAGQSHQKDLNDALDNIYNHSHVAPFICKQLIQRFVTSNPSPAYLERVSNVFNQYRDSDVQLQEVLRAILLDEEARGDYKDDPNYGKLREPILFVTNFLRAMHVRDVNGVGLSDGVLNTATGALPNGSPINITARMGQDLFRSPTVFNYFPPDNAVPSLDPEVNILGPEFGIQNTVSTLDRINFIYRMVYQNGIPRGTTGSGPEDKPNGTSIRLGIDYVVGHEDPNWMVEYLNNILLHGTMSDSMRQIILQRLEAIPANDLLGRARAATYLVAASSQYQVQR